MSSAAFDPTGYAGYFEITSDNTAVNETTGDLCFDLANAPASFWSTVAADGRDIRVVNAAGDTAYSFEVDASFDVATRAGVLYFDCSDDLSASNDVAWRVYAGNPSATMPGPSDTLGRNNVWAADHEAVWHLDQDPSGVSPQMTDSTGSDASGTSHGSMATESLVAGKLGSAVEFDGSDDYLACGDIGNLSLPVRVEGWFRTTSASTQAVINTDSQTDYAGLIVGTTSGKVFAIYGDNTGVGSPNRRQKTSASAFNDDSWHHFVVVARGANDISIYVDGADDGGVYSGTGGTMASTGSPVNIGRRFSDPSFAWHFDGELDEIRVVNADAGLGYAVTHYNNQSDPGAFWTVGSWVPSAAEDPPVASPTQGLAGDPAHLLVVYNSDLPDSVAWANDYAIRRAVPIANRLGVSLPADEVIDEAEFASFVTAINAHLNSSGLSDTIATVLCGFGVPGGVLRADGLIDPVAARLQRADGQATETNNPLHTGATGSIVRPGLSNLNGDRVVARIDAPTLADAIAISDRAQAVEAIGLSGDADGGGAVWLDPYPPNGSVYELRRDQMLGWAVGHDRQRLRVPLRLPEDPGAGDEPQFDRIENDGFFWGWIQATPAAGFFGSSAGRRVFAVQLSPDHATVPTLRDANENSWVSRFIAAGYAGAAGGTRAFTPSAVPRVEPFFEALRLGWTLGEAWHVASPLLRSGLVLVGDPLMTVAMPRVGWDLYGPFDTIEGASFVSPAVMLRDDERSIALPPAQQLEDTERGVYVLRHVDPLGRCEAGLRHVYVERNGNAWHSVPAAPAWPTSPGYRLGRADNRWNIDAAWAAAFGSLGITSVQLEQQIDADPASVVDEEIVAATASRIAFTRAAPAALVRYRVVAVSPGGIRTPGPWSQFATPPSVETAALPLL